eukprot:Phypoly_transcript_01909.p2 GENE.Phypoly_transcript_01909~~Phypoly_transcript_01909.p2  ORF type:complete len:361 (+),score=47.23 Phypoly_transcript_01909:1588-2670(+)
MNTHDATNDIANKATECPFFSQQGCPYAKHTTFDLAAIKKHPAFAAGCPYKGVDTSKLKDCPAFNKDHKCPFDGSHQIDISKINSCPAFKQGCPYSQLHKHEKHDHTNMTEHSATEHIAAEATKCPVFAHAKCPFDPKHPHSLDLSKVTECPAFQRSGGCPFKGVHLERLKECPAFKDGKCPFDGTKPVDLSRIKECPAFNKGCPYSNLHSTTGSVWDTRTFFVHISQEAQQCPFFAKQQGGCPYDPSHRRSFDVTKVKDCPAFSKSGGCPFKNVRIDRLQECPAFKDGKCPFDGTVQIDLSRLKECPAFIEGCPYKTVTAPAKEDTHTEEAGSSTHPSNDDVAKCPFASMHGKVENPHK